MRWLLIFVLAFVVFNVLHAWLHKRGFGRLPGDFRLRLFGREVYVPLGSSLVLSLIALVVGRLI